MGRLPNLALLSFLCHLAAYARDATATDPYAAQPKLFVEDGNLKLQAGKDKNITLLTSGAGQVFLNEENLVRLSNLARTASNQVESFKWTLQPLQDKVERLLQSVEGKDGLLRKIQGLESSNTSVSVPGSGSQKSLASLSVTVQRLEKTLTRLSTNLRQNECRRRPCQNGGTCIDLYKKFKCLCRPGWEGLTCDRDVNECARLAHTDLSCQNGATCLNTPGSFVCLCAAGYFGMHCTLRNSSCVSGSDRELCEHGTCRDVGAGRTHECVCQEGWTHGEGGRCNKDINECASRMPVCSIAPPVQCLNTPGSFECGPCPAGYTGNGMYCVDIDECLVNNGGCSMSPYVECLNTQGYRKCGSCPPGFVGDGTTCRQGLTGCSINNGDCHPLATCTETTDSSRSRIVCSCPPGMAGNGRGLRGCASDMSGNPCAAQPCGVNGACLLRGPAAYECACDPGFRGKHCELPVITGGSCFPNPCQNGGVCTSTYGAGVSCQCKEGFEGALCSDPVLSCGGTLAGHNGTLHSPDSRYTAASRFPLTCLWTLESGDGVRVIQLNFTRLIVHSKRGDCLDSYVEIRDAELPSHSSSILGHYCSPHSLPSGTVTSYSPKVTITYTMTSAGESSNEWSLNWTTVDAECGATLADLSAPGVLSSPGFPRPFSTGTACIWMLSARPGYRLEFTISEITFERKKEDRNQWSSCEDVYTNSNVRIYDGMMMYHPLLLSVCNSSRSLPAVTTSGAEGSVLFHSIAGRKTSFQIMYRPVPGVPGCGGTFTSPEGDITSRPLEELNQDLLCEWTVHLAVNEKLRLLFTRMEINSPTCDSYLEVYNGRSGSLLEKFCDGAQARGPLTTEGNSIRIVYKMHYDDKRNRPAFSIHYESVCGGVFSAPRGVLASPYYPRAYPLARLCRYTITQEPGKIIELDLHYLDLSPPADKDNACTYQSVKVYNGDSANHTLLGEYCGNKVPPTIISTRNILYVEYKTDGSLDHSGFEANYSTVDLGCGGIYTAASGTITLSSPLTTASCEWILSMSPGNAVHLTWVSFSVRADPTYNWWNYGDKCDKMYLSVHDNGTTPAMLMDRLCGVETPPPMTSQGNVVTLRLVNNNFDSNKGPGLMAFVLNYVTVNSSTLCGGNYFATSGILSSPLYPDSYPPNKQCVWTIQVPREQQIRLNFTSFRLETGWRANCANSDYLEVRDGGYASSPLKGKYCGVSYPEELVSSSNRLYLKFVSDEDKNTYPGFQITWDSAATGCGGILNAPSGFLASPNYPYSYNYRATCYWRIYVAQGSAVSLVTLDISMDCFLPVHGTLEVYDGDSVHGRLIARYCGQPKWNQLIQSESSSMLIKYTSNPEDKGFHVAYSTACNRTVSGYRGVIESSNYPLPYEPRSNCWWNITVPPGNQIDVAFSDFQLERRSLVTHFPRIMMHPALNNGNTYLGNLPMLVRSRGCFDFLEIFDTLQEDTWQGSMQKELNVLLNKTCGKESPTGVITSHANSMFIHFYSDFGTNAKGFHLEWSLKGCGGVFENRPYGTITSPNFGEHAQGKYYGHSLQCNWEIRTDLDHSIEINILEVDLETNSECQLDYLIIYNGLNADGTNLTNKLCHKASNNPITVTASHQAFVRFVSDMSINGRGFKLYFKLVPSTCGGRYVGTAGVIHSKNYPKNYEAHDDCLFEISVPEGHLVRLTLEDLDLGSCFSAGRKLPVSAVVHVYDGDSVNAPLLMMYCGNTVPPNATSLVSSGNTLLVHFRAGEFHPHKGFKASYSLACGARIVTDGSGTLTTNVADMIASAVYNCSWTIVAKTPESRVSLALQSRSVFQLYSRDWADFATDGFYVYDGEDSYAPLLVKSGIAGLPASVQGKSAAMYVVLQVPAEAAESLMHEKFFATYSVRNIACGGELRGDGGTFSSPNYPLQYPLNADCVWTVKSSPGNKIAIQFSSFELEDDAFCNEDFVEVREGSGSGKLLGAFCGTKTPGNITVTSHFWIRFRSNGVGTAPGFTADYSYVEDVEILGETSGQISSPQYPDPYFNTKTFSWYIRVAQNSRVRFKILDSFLEGRQDDCNYYGVLKIYEGNARSESQLLHPDLCSAPVSTEITSVTPEALVQFDSSPMKRGSYFKLAWTAVTSGNEAAASSNTSIPEALTSPFPYLKNARHVSLNLNLSAPQSFISYRSSVAETVVYMVTSPPGYRVTALVHNYTIAGSILAIVKVHVYSGSADPFRQGDIVKLDEITENPNLNSSSAKTVTSHNNALYLVIEELFVDVLGGEYVTVSLNVTVSLACGGIITGLTSGTIQMNPSIANQTRVPLQQPLYRVTDLTCDWVIAARPRRRLRVTLLSSDLTPKTNVVNRECGTSYLQIRNGGSITSPRLGEDKFCSPIINFRIGKPSNTTSSNLLFVRYKYGYSFVHSFSLSFEEVGVGCGGELSLSEGPGGQKWVSIASPSYPEAPPSHIQCLWFIRAPSHRRLQVRFKEEEFDLDMSINCEKEYVEIRDGSTELSPALSKFCHSPPPLVKSSGTALRIKYFTDTDEPKNGFIANVSLETCGGSVERIYNSYTLRVFYPQLTEPTCEWTLSTGAAAYLTLNVTRFNVNRVSLWMNCSATNDDTLQVRVWNRMNGNQTLVFSECSPAAVPFYLRTDASRITVTFLKGSNKNGRGLLLSNGDLSRTGFSITVTAVPEPCGGALTAPSGEISLPCVPGGEGGAGGMERFCVWTMRAPVDRSIVVTPLSVQFNALNMVPDEEAAFDGPEDAIGFFYSDITDTRYRRPFTLFTSPASTNRRVQTSGSSLSVIARVRSHCPSGGFRLKYTTDTPALCGGTLADQGTLFSPNGSLSAFSCEWSKVIPPYQTFAVTISGIVSAQDSNKRCNSSSAFLSNTLILYNHLKQLIHRLCSTYDTPTTFLSPFRTTLIHAIKGRTYTNMWQSPPMEFNISYTSYPCGGALSSPSNISISPNISISSNSSENVLNCVWLVEYPAGDEIKVSFVRESAQCTYTSSDSYFYIYNGPRPLSSPLMAKVHPCTTSDPVTSTSNTLWIEYRGSSHIASQVSLNLEKVALSCGDILSSPVGVIESPGYADRTYPANIECEWYIQVEAGFFISLQFVDRFFIQDSVNCSSDYLEMFDWVNEAYKSVAKLCGRAATGEFNSTRNQMKLVFHTDEAVSGDGFRVTYKTHCGGIYNSSNSVFGESRGVISSPRYPNDYPPNLSCNYTFIDEEKLIALNFSDFKLEPSAGCSFDHLTIVSSTNNSLSPWHSAKHQLTRSKTRALYCGESGPGYVTFVDWVSVLFESDPFVSNRGFLLEYSMSKCGGDINTQQRVSVFAYKESMQCSWFITAPPQMTAVVTVTSYQKHSYLFFYNDCTESVKFSNILPNGTVTPISELCRSTSTPYVMRATEVSSVLTLDSLYFDFVSDWSNPVFQFMVTFTYGPDLCKTPLTLAAGSTTHLTPGINSNQSHVCEQTLSTAAGYSLRLRVAALNIYTIDCASYDSSMKSPVDWATLSTKDNAELTALNASGCWCNRLEISWGSNVPQILCMENQTISPLYADSSTVTVRFIQSQFLAGLTYDLEVTSVLPVCGLPTLKANSSRQVFTSPALQPGLRCVWAVQWEGAPKNIRVQFLSFKLGRADNASCSDTYVQFVQNGAVLGKFCGTSLPPVIYFPTLSSDSNVKRSIELRASSALSTESFQLEYQVVGCSRNYSNDQGNLVYMEQAGGECHVILSTNSSIEALVFSQFSLASKNCQTDKLVVRDMSSNTHLATLCDTGLPLPLFPSSRQLSLHLYASQNSTSSARVSLTFVTSQCGLVLRDPSGALVSQNYPKSLRKAETCSVNIVPPRPVTLKFRVFDLGSAKCATNYLRIELQGGSVIKYCGREVPAELEIGEQGATLTYVTDEGNDGQGWYLTYELKPE